MRLGDIVRSEERKIRPSCFVQDRGPLLGTRPEARGERQEVRRARRAKTRPASVVQEHGPVLGEQKNVPEPGALLLVPTLRVHVLGQKSENTRLREKARRENRGQTSGARQSPFS